VSRQSKDEWLRDIDARQRNIVFPDTVQNKGRFWRNLYHGKEPLNTAQWIGVILLYLSAALSLGFFVYMLWPRYEAPWWRKLIPAYGVPAIIFIAVVLFVVWGNRKARRSSQSHHKSD
jgi:hypothetical protein